MVKFHRYLFERSMSRFEYLTCIMLIILGVQRHWASFMIVLSLSVCIQFLNGDRSKQKKSEDTDLEGWE